MWFRITLAKDGAVRSCEEVSQSFENTDTVIYIEADTKGRAIERARKQWKSRYRKRLYYEKKELGICTQCNEPAETGFVLCATHRERSLEAQVKTYDKKRALGLTGADRIPPDLDARRLQQAQMIANRKYGSNPAGLLNLRTLLICQANFEQMDRETFARWLGEQIAQYRAAQRKGGRAA